MLEIRSITISLSKYFIYQLKSKQIINVRDTKPNTSKTEYEIPQNRPITCKSQINNLHLSEAYLSTTGMKVTN